MVSFEQNEVGMIVDEVSEVVTISEEAVEAAPAIATTVDSAFIRGIAKVPISGGGQRLVILLDLNRVLSVDEQLSLQAL